MEDLRSAMEEHMELMADLVQKLSSEIRSGARRSRTLKMAPAWMRRDIRGTMVDVLAGIPFCLTDNNNLLQEEH
ncbi:hypothetical protein F3Y22_tig00116965pilonHSYRG00719 [Hibiscus syriacus]|uniref:Uncharacterized protein n=1 Tax=Hibiscus syriacus TaxID=106335 RepID=A0A6A2XAA7_HIBSY|nr:hypothetical protein F3Y22_tig00116965pilonHSYRG00719 [Hibiscus syriacus]